MHKRKSIWITKYGAPEVLKLQEDEMAFTSDLPKTPGVEPYVLIEVKACGLNFADLMMRMGLYAEAPPRPFIPGYEIAGIVKEVQKGVTKLKPGDRVVAPCKFGGYTNLITLPESYVYKIPDHLSFEEAACIPVNFITAWIALHEMGRVRKGDTVLIQSAAGGVGTAAVQMAALAGAKVTGLVGSVDKKDYVKKLGAQEVLTYSEYEQKRNSSPPPRYDIILDSKGGSELKKCFKDLASMGRVITFGASQMITSNKRSILSTIKFLFNTPLFPSLMLMMANKGVFGLNVLQLVDNPQRLKLMFDEILKNFEEKKFHVHVGGRFPLEHAAQAHLALQSGKNLGKVVLTLDP